MELPADLDRLLGPRDVVVVEGADAQRYLHSQVSQAILDQAVGEQRWTFVLEPTGKIDALARITRTADDRFELDTDAGFGEALLARVNRFKIRVAVDTSLRSAVDATVDPAVEHDRVVAGWPRMGAEIIPARRFPLAPALLASLSATRRVAIRARSWSNAWTAGPRPPPSRCAASP